MAKHQWLSHCCFVVQWVNCGLWNTKGAHFDTKLPKWNTKVTRAWRAHISPKLVKALESSQIRSALPSDVTCRCPCGILLYPAWKSKIDGFAPLRKSSILIFAFSLIPAYQILQREIYQIIIAACGKISLNYIWILTWYFADSVV